MAAESRNQSVPGPSLAPPAQALSAPTQPPDVSATQEKDGATVPPPNPTVGKSSQYPQGNGTKADFLSDYIALQQEDSECKNRLL